MTTEVAVGTMIGLAVALGVPFVRWSGRWLVHAITDVIDQRLAPKHSEHLAQLFTESEERIRVERGKQLAHMNDELRLIREELTINGGASLKDTVIQLNQRMSNIESQLEVRLLDDPHGKGRA